MSGRNIAKTLFIYFIVVLISSYSQLLSQDFWYPTQGPYGGNTLCFAENASGTLFVGTEGGGVFRSADNGDNWDSINEGIPIVEGITGYNIYSILVHTNGDIFIGTSKEGRIFRSSDNGSNWTLVYNSTILSLVIASLSSTPDGSILAGTDGAGILKSTDNGNTWTSTSLVTNTIRSFVISENNSILAATNSGIYKSNDNGDNWVLSNSGLTTTNTYALLKNTSGTIFCTAGISKIFKSTDNGSNWLETGSGLPSSVIYSLGSNSSNVLFSGTISGLYKSTDDGSSWIADSLQNKFIRWVAFNSSDDLFAGTAGEGIYRSDQGSSVYEVINTGLKNTFINAMTFALNGDFYAGTNNNRFYKSSDLGINWLDISDHLIVFNSPARVLSLLTYPNGDIIAGTFNQGIFRTTNNGDYWLHELSGLTTYNIYSLALDRQANILAGSTSKLYKSANFGQDWEAIDNGQINYNIQDIAVNSLGHIFVATNGGGVFRSTNDGNSWTQINNGFIYNYAFAIAIKENDDIFVTGEMTGIYRSTDNGDTWTSMLTATLPAYDIMINDLGDIFVSSIDAQGVLRSIDNGVTWQQINSGLYNYNVRSLCLSANTFLYAGGAGTGVWVSGLPTGSNLFGTNSNISLPIPFNQPVSNTITISGNSGPNNFQSSNSLIENLTITIQEINHPNINDLIITLEHLGVVDTLVNQIGVSGANFLGTKLNDDALLDLSQGSAPFSGSYKPYSPLSAFYGTEATGDWVLSITDVVSGNEGTLEAWSISISTESSNDVTYTVDYPVDFKLEQNYPNPFNPTTKIKYRISDFGFVSLKVYDVLGNEVTTLVNEEKSAGRHEVNLNATNLSSGIYLYRLQANSLIETKKMILMK